MTDHDLRALSTLRRDADHWRRLSRDLYHCGIAAYQRIAQLERRVSELMEERERIARSVFRDAPPKEQA